MKTTLKKAIIDKGYNVERLAKELDIHKSNIYNHIKGFSTIGVTKAKKIAAFLNISLDDIYAD